jgi:poly(3-hydroxybutyrate) depolymerase
MRRLWTVTALSALPLAIIMAAPAAQAATPGKVTKEQFIHGARRISYYLFVPKEPTAPASAPLVVLLHGSERDGSSLIDPWKRLAEKEGIVLLAPDAQNLQGWNVPVDGPEPLCSLVDHLRQSLPVINARRMYLFGHSAGAVFLLYMAMLESDYFAAGALHAGAWRSHDDFAAVETLGRKIPLALTVGDGDRFFPVADVEATAEALRKAGVPVEMEVIPSHDHNYYLISGKVNDWAWAELKRHALSEDPRFIPRQFQ